MRFAVITDSTKCVNDNLFFKMDESGRKILTDEEFWKNLYEEMTQKGHEIHTVDLYNESDPADYYLFLTPEWEWVHRLTRKGRGNRLVYCCCEPPTVIKYNTIGGFKIMKGIFPYILTTNREWVNNINIFIRNIPYVFDYNENLIPFKERKLLTAISANKHSTYKGELYSERERSYSYFEKECPQEFDFYGNLWEGTIHPCYRGTVKSKTETFQKYKFALCFENTSDIPDYVSEKIFDCICSGIVPIYAGAPNIRDFLSEDCFIDYFSFGSLDELKKYLTDMDEQTYQKYVNAGKRILYSDLPQRFSMEQYVTDIIEAVQQMPPYVHTVQADLWMIYRDVVQKIDRMGLKFRIALKRCLKKIIR